MASVILEQYNHFGRSNTFNPFSNSTDLKLINEKCFSIPSQVTFANTNALCIATGLVSNGNSFLSGDFIAEILETNGTRLTYLTAKLGVVGANVYPSEFDILWFDTEGCQSDYWVNDKWKGKILRLSGKFECSAIIVDEMNKIHSNINSLPNTIKLNPPPVGATYTQWNINAQAPQSKWGGTSWQVASTKKVLIRISTFTNAVSNATFWLDNNTTDIECDCLGAGGGGTSTINSGYAGGGGSITYNGQSIFCNGGNPGISGSTNGRLGSGYAGLGYYSKGGEKNVNASGVASGGAGLNGTAVTLGEGGLPINSYTIFSTSYKGFNINTSLRYLNYTVGAGGNNTGLGSSKGANGVVSIIEYTTETIYIRIS